MGLMASWEEFAERTLVRYLAGASSGSGYQPTLKHGQADSIEHAYIVLSLDPNYRAASSYLKVSDPAWIWSRADFFFAKHPYGCLRNSADLIRHANKIRNRVAHDSLKCKSDFKATAVHFLQPANGNLSQGYGAGDLLMSPAQRHFAQSAIHRNLTIFHSYVELLKNLAETIVPPPAA